MPGAPNGSPTEVVRAWRVDKPGAALWAAVLVDARRRGIIFGSLYCSSQSFHTAEAYFMVWSDVPVSLTPGMDFTKQEICHFGESASGAPPPSPSIAFAPEPGSRRVSIDPTCPGIVRAAVGR